MSWFISSLSNQKKWRRCPSHSTAVDRLYLGPTTFSWVKSVPMPLIKGNQSLPNSFYSLHALHASKGCRAGSHHQKVKPWFISLRSVVHHFYPSNAQPGAPHDPQLDEVDHPSRVDSGVTGPGSPCLYKPVWIAEAFQQLNVSGHNPLTSKRKKYVQQP